MKKSDLLNNLREYSSDQIADAINAGIVTMYELSKSGNLTPLMRKRIEEKLSSSLKGETNQSSSSTNDNISIDVPDMESAKIDIAVEQQSVEKPLNNEEEKGDVMREDTETISNKGMFRRPFSFEGRIRRLEYGISYIIYFVWAMIVNVAAESSELSPTVAVFILVSYIPMMWFLLAQNCKRCHDRGNSGWWQLIPFYGLWLLFGDGEDGTNDYGSNPKED